MQSTPSHRYPKTRYDKTPYQNTVREKYYEYSLTSSTDIPRNSGWLKAHYYKRGSTYNRRQHPGV